MAATTELQSAPDASPSLAVQRRLAALLNQTISYLPQIDYSDFHEETVRCEELQAGTRLDADREAVLFGQMHFAFARAADLRGLLDLPAPDGEQMAEIERLVLRGQQLRNGLAIVFTKLSYSIAKGFVTPQFPFDELVSEAQTTLLYAISKFNPQRGFRFSTYCTHAIRRSLTRFVVRSHATRELRVDWQTVGAPESRGWSHQYERKVVKLAREVDSLLSKLSVRERYIIRSRFGWGRDFDTRTLQAIADELGVTRERIRQLEHRALRKLRILAEAVDH